MGKKGKRYDKNNDKNYSITKHDISLILIIVLIYGVISFINLGSLKSPQTFWNTKEQGNTIILRAQNNVSSSKIRHFSGARAGNYQLSISNDNITYTPVAVLEEEKVFKWYDTAFQYNFKYLMIKSINDEESIMGELCVYDENGQKVPLTSMTYSGNVLVDEVDTVPDNISYLNSTYFDEIYHARTAYEYLENMDIYEWTHPPLGKLIISAAISMLGMTPFAYRLMGNIAGILMLVVIYIFGKRIFGSSKYAFLASLLLAADGMHFVQTRIATVDSFLVLFMLLSYLFMYQYIMCETKSSLKKKLINLFFSGVFLGASIATKWNGAYVAIGLAVIFFIDLAGRLRDRRFSNTFRIQVPKIIGGCVVCFIAVPIAIYLMSYIPFFMRPENSGLEDLWRLQLKMYHYHADLEATHPFTSPWYLWPLGIKPVWYYQGSVGEGYIASIVAHSNPIIWWSGLVGILYCFKEAIIERDKSYRFLSIAIIGVYLPYILIPRIMFLYHYFPIVPLMILALVGLLKALAERIKRFDLVKWYSIVAVVVFAFFYPIYVGATIPRWYANLTVWLPQWHFFN